MKVTLQKLEKISFNIVLGAVAALLILVVAELGARFLAGNASRKTPVRPGPQAPVFAWEMGQYNLFPYLMYRLPPRKGKVDSIWRTNSRGLRGPEFESQKPEGVFRVIILGGSSAYGIGAGTFELSFIGVLAAELNKGLAAGKKIEVINAAQPGFNSTQEFIFLQQELLDYNPDMVIFFDGYNDVQIAVAYKDNFPEGAYWETPFNYGELRQKIYTPDLTRKRALEELMGTSVLYRKLVSLVKQKPPAQPRKQFSKEERAEWGRLAIEKYRQNLDSAFLILKDRNIIAAVGVQPILSWNRTPTEGEKKFMMNWADPTRLELITELYPEVVEAAQKAATNRGALFWDYTVLFESPAEQVYVDWCHYNPLGHKIVGEDMVGRIKPLIPEGFYQK